MTTGTGSRADDTRDDDIRAALRDLAAAIELTATGDPVADVHDRRLAHTEARRPAGRVLALAAAVVLVVGVAVAVVVAGDGDSGLDVVTDPTGAPVVDAPPGLDGDLEVVLRPVSAWARPGDDLALRLQNASPEALRHGPMLRVSRWSGEWVRVADAVGLDPAEQTWEAPEEITLDYEATVVEPFGGESMGLRLPAGLEPGHYRVELYEALRGVEGDAVEAVVVEGRFEVVAPDGDAREPVVVLGGPLAVERAVLPDALVALDDGRVAIRYTTACNQPAQEIRFTTNGAAVLVEVRVGGFTVIDCVGEPADWSVVVESPVPLVGKRVVGADDLGNRLGATAAEVTATTVLFEDAGTGSPGDPAQLLGEIGGPTGGIAPAIFSAAPACSNIVRVARVETTAGAFTEVRDAGSPGADCVLEPGWAPLPR